MLDKNAVLSDGVALFSVNKQLIWDIFAYG